MSKEFKGLNLDRRNIIPSVKRYCSIHYGDKYEVASEFVDKGTTRKRLHITVDNRPFYIDFHFNTSDGTTTIEDSGGREVYLKQQLAKFIREDCLLSNNCSNNWFVVDNIDRNDFNSILEIIQEEELYKETLIREQDEKKFIYQCKSKYDEKVTITYYNSGKVVVQGRPLLLFNDIITMFSELIDDDDITEVFNDCYQIDIKKDSVIKQYEIKMPNSYDKHTPKLKKVLLQAVYNTNIRGDMFEYSYLVYPALRALEGHIKYVYKDNQITGYKSIGSIFDKVGNVFYLQEDYKENLDEGKVKYIEDAYNYYYANRHTLFHWDNLDLPQDGTRIIENYGEAIRIINDTLKRIDSYYEL